MSKHSTVGVCAYLLHSYPSKVQARFVEHASRLFAVSGLDYRECILKFSSLHQTLRFKTNACIFVFISNEAPSTHHRKLEVNKGLLRKKRV